MGNTEDAFFLKTLKLCVKSQDLAWGKHVHACMVLSKIKIPVFFLNILADMYAKCGSLEDARAVFDGISKLDVVSWNVMISCYAKHGMPEVSIELFRQMETVGVPPDNVTFVGIFDACAEIGDLRLGAEAHIGIAFSGLIPDSTSTNSLIKMYSRCGSMELSCKVFDRMDDRNVVSWNTILSGFSIVRDTSKVLAIFNKMEQNNVTADKVSYISVLNACSFLGDVELVQDVHAKIKVSGIELDLVLENALLDTYMKCGSVDIACQFFNQMLVRNVVSWTIIIALHSSMNSSENSFVAFSRMQCEAVSANDVTMLAILGVFSSSGELQKGKQIHTSISSSAWKEVVNVQNAVVAMYSKCGTLMDAREFFINMKARDVVSWNTIMSSYAKHGHGRQVLDLAQQMSKEGFNLDSASLASILSVCSRTGLIVEAFSFLSSMEMEKGPLLTASHYACMVDLLARAGLLQTADKCYSFILDEPNLASWRALLGACKLHRDSKLAKAIANAMLSKQSYKTEVRETISNMHYFLADNRVDE